MTVTAGMPLPNLLVQASHAGWGPLQRRHTVVLHALGTLVNWRSAAGHTTGAQLGPHARYGRTWTYTTLRELEQMGILTWRRGFRINGQSRASWFRINKQALVDLIMQNRRSARVSLTDTFTTLSGGSNRRHGSRRGRPPVQTPQPPPVAAAQPPPEPAATSEYALATVRSLRETVRKTKAEGRYVPIP